MVKEIKYIHVTWGSNKILLLLRVIFERRCAEFKDTGLLINDSP
jgi:hypothetical protein